MNSTAAGSADKLIATLKDRIEELEAKLKAATFVCHVRERELLELKGPCRNYFGCGLHFAHSGPCDGRVNP
jgi:hypothetical protein